jgi:hypothetical protein
MTADAPRLLPNVREGVKRLLIVAAIASACSIGATTWAWREAERSLHDYESALDAWEAAERGNSPATLALAKERAGWIEATFTEREGRFLSFRKWTAIGHLIAAAAGLLLWALSGFVARQKAPLTAAADPHRLTGSADTGPPADKEG